MGQEKSQDWNEVTAELKVLGSLAWPLILSYTLTFGMNIVDLAMIGHYGTFEMAAVCLGMVFYNIVFDPLYGMASGLETGFTQAFGARNMHLYGQWLIVGTVVLFITAVPTAVLLLESETILNLLYDDHKLTAAAATYVKVLVLGVLPQMGFVILTKFLNSQQVLWPLVYIAIVVNLINGAVQYLFIFSFGWGLYGAPFATVLTRTTHLLMVAVYIAADPAAREGWPVITWESISSIQLTQFADFVAIGAAGWSMEAMSVWGFEGTGIISSWLSHEELNTNNIILNIFTFMYIGVLGAISMAMTIRVGNLLGEGNGDQARSTSITGIWSTALLMVVILIPLVFWHDFGYIFTDNDKVVGEVSGVLPVMAIAVLCFSVFLAVSGSFRGMGKQYLVFILSFVGIWVVGLGLGWNLTFHWGNGGAGLGVFGLWLGLAIGLLVASILGSVWLFLGIDWAAEVSSSLERNTKGSDGDQTRPLMTGSRTV